jgi:integrase
VREGETVAVELVAHLIDGELPGVAATLDRVVEAFRRDVLPAQCAKQQVETRRELELWTNVLGAKFQLGKLGKPEWNAFIRDRSTGRIDGRGVIVKHDERRPVGNRAVAKSLKVVRHLCRFAVDHRMLDADPTRGFDLPTVKNPKRPVADSARFERLLAVARETMMFDAKGELVPSYLEYLLILAHETGHRISAILHLRWSDWLPGQGSSGSLRWRAEHDKTGLDDTVPVTPHARAAVDRLRSEHPGVGEAFLFPKLCEPSKPVPLDAAAQWLLTAERKAGLEHVPGGAWHAFRRLWATSRKQHPPKDVAQAGGWKDTATLMKCYMHADPDTVEAVVNGGQRLRMTR